MAKNTLVILAVLLIFSPPVFAKYSGGKGTSESPYQIATPNDLNDIGDVTTDPNVMGKTTSQMQSESTFTDCRDVNDCNSTDLGFSGSVYANDLDIFTTYWLFGKGICNPLFSVLQKGIEG